ncbi:Na/Pi cotransporter family protein [Desulforamulus ruminis]|uniref:Na/Pi-cotransporter II-related protein n=1 Tax=Desulforamulus ruminis (strain ATCC 23193 / DSM 2154 / NCIMB 8452 / DL) TaxID=696281 RepID=F6DTA0_DESRL|nr:Na/Pi cotransporter family protein [Desulforamulus ruminis]AEG58917.1 Na/Pi-cotransporter II-related protein [Desulforamulus ruminis DSM 2154]
MTWQNTVFSMIGGVGFLLYGMSLMKDNLQKIAGKKFRETIIYLTKNRVSGLALGTLITLVFQSSTATTVLLIGLTSASIISLRNALAVILGADIGSTVTAQLIALKVTELSLPIICIGTFLFLWSKTNRRKRMALAIIGFGLLFLGLKIMSDTMSPLKNDPSFSQILIHISNHPLLDIALAALFTFLMSSSAATIGIIMLLAMQHMIALQPAIYMLLGANIGTSFTPLLSSVGSSRESQRVAIAHFLFKITGVLLFFPFVSQLSKLISSFTASPGFQVANTHTFFNITMAILFLPFIQYFAKALEILVPDRKDDLDQVKPKYLDENLLSSPDLAIGMATKEIIHISDHIQDMVQSIYPLLQSFNQDKADKILQKEDKVDRLSLATNDYLTKLLRHHLIQDEFNRAMGLIHIVREYEFIGDVVERNIIGKAENMTMKNLEFNPMDQKEMLLLHQKTVQLLQVVNTAVATNNCYMADKAKESQENLVDFQFRLQMSHIARMQKDTEEQESISLVQTDLMNCYIKISEHLKNIAMTLTHEIPCTLQEADKLLDSPAK